MRAAKLRLAILLCVTALRALTASAGGPRWYTGAPFYTAPEGQPVVFFTTSPLYYTDPGDLNAHVTHAQADAMVAAAASTWNVPTSSLTLAQGGVLAQHVSSANTYFDGQAVNFPDDVKAANYRAKPIAIVYDTDGSVIDTLLGSGASSPTGCRQNGVVESVDGLDPAGTIDHAVLILNGRCVGANADQLVQMRYQLMRAFGRVIGLAWSQLNDNVFTGLPSPTALQVQNWPVMHPIDVLCGPYTYKCMAQPFVLRTDDLNVLALLYPVTPAGVMPGQTVSSDGAAVLLGWVRFPSGQGMDGVNVVVHRRVAFGKVDTYDSVSGVTGLMHRQFYGNPITGPPVGVGQSNGGDRDILEGLYLAVRLPMFGYFESIYATTEPINPLYSGEYAVTAYTGAPPAMSGSAVTMFDGLELAGRTVTLNTTMADAAALCYTGNDGAESAPAEVDASGWWSNVLCANQHTAWAAQAVKAGRSWTLETTAVDESGAGSTRKARLLMGLWKADDPTGTLPTVGRTPGPLNATSVGMTQMHVDAAGTPVRYRMAIADERGLGRPDFVYKARLLYADSVAPVQLGAGGGRITIAGQGFRSGNIVLVNGAAAAVTSWSATQIVAIAPARSAAGMSVAGAADVEVRDASTGGSTVMQAALSYGGVDVDSISLVSAPAQVTTGSLSSLAFAVRVLFSDGTPAPGAVVRFATSGAAATFSACRAAICTLTADANGLAQSYFTATAPGAITLTATEVSGGASVQAVMNAVAPVVTMELVSAPVQVRTGMVSATAFAVRVLKDGLPFVGAMVQVAATGAAASLGSCGATLCALTTDGNGVAQSLLTASAAGTVTLTATEPGSGVSVQAVVNAVAPVFTMALLSAPSQVTTGVVSNLAFAVRLFEDGLPLSAAAVRFTATGAAASFARCGSATCLLTTDANGLAQSYLTASAAGAVTLTAVEQSSGVMVQAVVNAVAPVITMQLVSAPSQLRTGAVSGTAFAVRLLQDGVAMSALVRFTASGAAATFAACGAATCALTTDAAGVAQSTVTATGAGAITLTATEPVSGAVVVVVVNSTAPVMALELVSAPAQLVTGYVSTTAFAVRLLQDGVPLAGAALRFAGPVSFAACGASPCMLTTGAGGVAQSLVSAAVAGALTLTAIEPASGASVQAVLTARDPVRIVVGLNGSRYLAAGAAASWTMSVAATEDGGAVAGQNVTWTAGAPLALGAQSSVTDSGGIAAVAVSTAGLGAGAQLMVEGCAWARVCASVAVFGVDPAEYSVAVVSGAGQSVQAGAALGPVGLRVTDAAGHPVEGASVSVYQTVDGWEGVCPPQGRCAAAPVLTASQATLRTDANGDVSVTPLEVAGVASVVNIAVVAGTNGFVTLALTKTP